jgi:hypothetical protein
VTESLGTTILTLSDSDLGNRADLFKEASNAVFVSTESKVTAEDGSGRRSTLTSVSLVTISVRFVTRELNLEDTSVKLSAVDSSNGLDSLIMVSVFDEGNTLEGKVLALSQLSITFKDFTYVIFVSVLANATDEELSLSGILRVGSTVGALRRGSSTAVRVASSVIRVFSLLNLLE